MLKTRVWQPPSLKQHVRRCWEPAEIDWAIFRVPTMGRMGRMRMMMKKILRAASFTKMTNPDGWWPQCPTLYSIARSVFGRSRWSLKNWHDQAGERRPITSVRRTRCTGRPHCSCWQSFNLKWQMMQRHLCPQQLVSLWRILIAAAENCKCRKWHLAQGVVIWG